jgi:hypothetical protein
MQGPARNAPALFVGVIAHLSPRSPRSPRRSLDPSDSRLYNKKFTVAQNFDLMKYSHSPAVTRWAALFLGLPVPVRVDILPTWGAAMLRPYRGLND